MFLAIIIMVIVVISFAALVGSKQRKHSTMRDDRRERNQLRNRDWWVLQWLYGNRAMKRLTDQRGCSDETK